MWTPKDADRARREGWDLFDHDCTGLLEIQKLDSPEDLGITPKYRFASDEEAIAFVAAYAGRRTLHLKALMLHVRDAAKIDHHRLQRAA